MTPLAHNIAGWGEDWIVCDWCGGEGDSDEMVIFSQSMCFQCGGEGGWPSTATRYDDEEDGE
jgi:hypothetical protein